MGNGTSNALEGGHLRRTAYPFASWPLKEVKELLESLKKIGTFVMVESQFCSWICSKIPMIQEREIKSLFEVLDSSQNGRVNCLEFLAGVMMLSDEDFSTKTQFCFELYDFNLNGCLSRHELVLMVRSTVLGTIKLLELDPVYSRWQQSFAKDAIFEQIADQAIRVYDRDSNRSLSYMEFVSWSRGNREVMSFVENFTVFSRAAAQESKGRASDPSSYESKTLEKKEITTELFSNESINNEGDMLLPPVMSAWEEETEDSQPIRTKDLAARSRIASALLNSNEEESKRNEPLFEGHLEVDWVYGHSGKRALNTVKYVDSSRERIVYPAGSAIIVRGIQVNDQLIYSGHSSPVIAVEVHPKEKVIASADECGEVHLWRWNHQQIVGESGRPQTSMILKTVPGRILLSFSRDGKLLAIASSHSKHSINDTNNQTANYRGSGSFIDVWDWALPERCLDTLHLRTESLQGIAWAPESEVLAVCGSDLVRLYTFHEMDTFKSRFLNENVGISRKSRSFDEIDANFRKGDSARIFTSLCFLGKNIVVGTNKGELYLFDRGSFALEDVVSAHGNGHKVGCLAEWSRGLVSAGDDGELRLWDMGLHPLVSVRPPKSQQEKFDEERKRVGDHRNQILLISPHDPLLFADTQVTSLTVLRNKSSKIALIGTSSGDIFEINIDERTSSVYRSKLTLVEGHTGGSLSGLAVHPQNSSIFVSCSEHDCTLRVWNSDNHSQIAACLLEAAGMCVSFSPTAEYLAVGLSNGKVSIRDPASQETIGKEIVSILSPEYDSDDRLCDMRRIAAVSFSPDGNYLAVSCLSGATYLFNVRRFSQSKEKTFVCIKALKARDLSVGERVERSVLDWSVSSNILKVALEFSVGRGGNTIQQSFWNVGNGGTQMDESLCSMKETAWATNNCPQDWSLTGLPRKIREIAVSFDQAGELLALGKRDGTLSLTKFPCKDNISSSQIKDFFVEKVRRSVSMVKFVSNGQFLLSCLQGKSDGHFVQWKILKEATTINDDAESVASTGSAGKHSSKAFDDDVEEEMMYLSGPALAWGSQGDNSFGDPFDLAGSSTFGDESMPHWQRKYSPPSPKHIAERKAVREVLGFPDLKEDVDFKLDSVIGLGRAGKNPRPTIKYLADHQVAYPVSGVIAIAKMFESSVSARPTQKLFQRHSTAVDVFAVSTLRGFVASVSGSSLLVWETLTLNVVSSIDLPWKEGVARVAFSPDEDFLAIVGKDINQTIAVFDWRKERLKGKSPGGGKAVFDLVWVSDSEFVCVGPRHVTFWRCNQAGEGPLDSRRGSFVLPQVGSAKPKAIPLQNVLSACMLSTASGDLLVTGFEDGSIGFWNCSTRSVVGWMKEKLKSPVFALCQAVQMDGCFFVGLKSGEVVFIHPRTGEESLFSDSDFFSKCGDDVANLFEVPVMVQEFGASVRCLDSVSKSIVTNDAINHRGRKYYGAHSSKPLCYLLVGSKFGETVELQFDLEAKKKVAEPSIICDGHRQGEVWGLAAHPTEPIVVTVGDDGFIFAWDLTKRQHVASLELPSKGKSLAFSSASTPVISSGSADDSGVGHVAVGFASGKVIVYELVDNKSGAMSTGTASLIAEPEPMSFQLVVELEEPKDWIQALSFSSLGTRLAVGSHDSNIYVYDASASYSFLFQLSGHSSFITNLDWSYPEDLIEREYLQSTSGAQEILFWNATDGVEIKAPKALRNADWATWSCLLGWSISGVEDISTASCCAKSAGGQSMAVGRKDGSVALFPFPCAGESSKMLKRAKAHSAAVTRVSFAANDKYMVTASTDGAICIWITNELEEISRAKASWMSKTKDEQKRLLEAQERKNTATGISPTAPADPPPSLVSYNPPRLVANTLTANGVDPQHPSIPWKVDRETWKRSCTAQKYSDLGRVVGAPTLDWVYGHSPGTGAHYVGGRDDILFTAGNVAVVQKPTRDGYVSKQMFFVEHKAKISCLAVTLDGGTIASGDNSGKVCVWDPCAMISRSVIELKSSITQVTFSRGGKYLGVADEAGVFYLCFVESGKQLACSADEATNGEVQGMLVLPRSEVSEATDVDVAVVAGDALKLWTFDPVRSRLTSKTAKASEGTVINCIIEYGGGLVSGHSDGSLVLWHRDSLVKRRVINKSDLKLQRVKNAGTTDAGGVVMLSITRTGLLLCLFESGIVLAVDPRFDPILDASFTVPQEAEFVCPDRLTGGDKLLVSFENGAISELNSDSTDPRVVQCGHWTSSDSNSLPEFSGRLVVALFESNLRHYAVSAGDNNLVHIWDLDGHKLVRSITVSDRPTACNVSPSNHHIAIGTKGGTLVVFSENLGREILRLSVSFQQSGDHLKDAIRSLTYSPDGRYLAVGGDDSLIRVFETRNYALVGAVQKQHTGPVTQIDWSTDGATLRSNSCLDSIPLADLLRILPRPIANEYFQHKAPRSKGDEYTPTLETSKEGLSWGTTSAPLTEHSFDLIDLGLVPVSSCSVRVGSSQRLFSFLLDGRVCSSSGKIFTSAIHTGIGAVSSTGRILVTAGLYDGLIFQFKIDGAGE